MQATFTEIVGVIDVDESRHGSHILGVEIVGGDELIESSNPAEFRIANGLGGSSVTGLRRGIFERFCGLGFEFATVVHPSAIGTDSVELRHGAQVLAGAVLQPLSCIGENSIVNTGAVIDHECSLGNHVHIAPGVTLSGGVVIGSGVMVGAGATIIQNVKIGENAFIAAGATVISNVEAGARVGGTPAREF